MIYAVIIATFIQGHGNVVQTVALQPMKPAQCTQRVLDDMGALVRVTTPGQQTATVGACETSTQVGLRLAQAVNFHGASITSRIGNITEWSYLE